MRRRDRGGFGDSVALPVDVRDDEDDGGVSTNSATPGVKEFFVKLVNLVFRRHDDPFAGSPPFRRG